MKNKLIFLWAVFFSIAASAEDDFTPDETKEFATHLPQYTNAVHITTNLLFFLSSRRYDLYPANQFKSDELLIQGLQLYPVSLQRTNAAYYFNLPFNQTYDFHLCDKMGHEIEKTPKGLAMSEPPKPLSGGRDRDYSSMTATRMAEFHAIFRPDDLFVITNKGTYDMTIAIRICVAVTNGVPDIYAMSNPFRTIQAKDFGIVESEPLRVKVIKE
jgi:hypothetical protein